MREFKILAIAWIIICIVAICFILFGCTTDTPSSVQPQVYQVDHSSVDWKSVVDPDGCEYWVHDEGTGSWRTYAMTHKGKCKNHNQQ